MSRAGWLNAALAVAVAALAAFVTFKSPPDAPVEYPLSALKPAEARSIRIERAGSAPLVLEKRHDGWHLTAPFAARGEETRVQRLLEILEAKSSHRLPATDLARFELDPPQARLIIDGHRFQFGMVSEVTREQYVLADGAVFPVHPRYGAALPAGAADLASRQLFGPGEAPVRIQLKAFTVEQRDGKWTLGGGTGDLSQDDFIRWVEHWRLASALRVEPSATTNFRDEIRVQLKNAGGLTLGILSRKPELVLVRTDEKLQYYFNGEMARRLLSPPGTAARSEAASNK